MLSVKKFVDDVWRSEFDVIYYVESLRLKNDGIGLVFGVDVFWLLWMF